MKYLLALVAFVLLASDASACDRAARRGGPLARIFAAERAVLRLPARIATAPLRFVSRTRITSRQTVYVLPAPKVAPCPPPKAK